MSKGGIPAAAVIDVDDAPDISPVDLISQIITNINAQVSAIDLEICAAQRGDSDQVEIPAAIIDYSNLLKF